MLCFPNAKINIGLNILERRPDNYHDIETFFYPVALCDILEIIIDGESHEPGVGLKLTGMKIEGEKENNLCYRAYHILSKDFRLQPVKIFLHKIIPPGSGIGGGSSDGANTLALLNKLFNLGLGTADLKTYAAQLGSDCPFFIENKPSVGTGKGENLLNSKTSLAGCYLVIVKPNLSVSTADAYAGVNPFKPANQIRDLIKLPVSQWKDVIANDFEKTVFTLHPEIKEIKDLIYSKGALYASMSGSGSAVYGIFENEVQLKDFFPGMFYWSAWL